MVERHANTRGVLYHIVCAAPPAQKVQDFVVLAQATGWDVCVIATPHAIQFINISLLERLTGYPVRSEFKAIGAPDIFPAMDIMVVAPMTLNTTTKWVQGNADTLALSQLCKGLGLGVPIIAVPCITSAFAHHPVFPKSIALLKEYGVHVLYEPENYPAPKIVPWETVTEVINAL